MIKRPTTKRLPEEIVMAAVDKDGNQFQKLFPDERFHQVPWYPNVFVSQYANVITTSRKTLCWRSPYYNPENGYTSIVLMRNKEHKLFYLHELVASVWLKKPSFQLDSPLQIHHKTKVKDNLTCQPINLNFAEQLQYTYLKYHSMLDSIKTMRYYYKRKWHTASEPEEIASAYGVSAYSIYELLLKEPSDIKGKYKLYTEGKIKIKVQEVTR